MLLLGVIFVISAIKCLFNLQPHLVPRRRGRPCKITPCTSRGWGAECFSRPFSSFLVFYNYSLTFESRQVAAKWEQTPISIITEVDFSLKLHQVLKTQELPPDFACATNQSSLINHFSGGNWQDCKEQNTLKML